MEYNNKSSECESKSIGTALESFSSNLEPFEIDSEPLDIALESLNINPKPLGTDRESVNLISEPTSLDSESLDTYIGSLHLDKVDNAHINIMAAYVIDCLRFTCISNGEDHFNFEDRKTYSEAIDRYVRIIELTKKEKMPKYAIWNNGNCVNIIIISKHIEERMYELFDEWSATCKQEKIDTDIIRGTLNRLDDVNKIMQFFYAGGSCLAEIFGIPWAIRYNEVTIEHCEIVEYVQNYFLMSSIICPNMKKAIEFRTSRMNYFEKISFWKNAGMTVGIKKLTSADVRRFKSTHIITKGLYETMDYF